MLVSSMVVISQFRFIRPTAWLRLCAAFPFGVDRGKTLGIVGESGSGKSVATQTVAGLTRGARVSGKAVFEGRDLLTMSDLPRLRAIRGPGIGMIFQNPLSSLHPFYRVGWQIVEMIRAHESASKEQARKRAIELLGLVGIPRPERRVDDYPHQFSGGMLQRAMIAMALALRPRLLIADEPTTALDVTVQAQILRLMRRLQSEFGDGNHPDHARSGSDRRSRRRRHGDVRRPGDGARAASRTLPAAKPPLYRRIACFAAPRERSQRATDGDCGAASKSHQSALRLSLPSSLSAGDGSLQHADSAIFRCGRRSRT